MVEHPYATHFATQLQELSTGRQWRSFVCASTLARYYARFTPYESIQPHQPLKQSMTGN